MRNKRTPEDTRTRESYTTSKARVRTLQSEKQKSHLQEANIPISITIKGYTFEGQISASLVSFRLFRVQTGQEDLLWSEVVHDVQDGLVGEVSEARDARQSDILDQSFRFGFLSMHLSKVNKLYRSTTLK